MASKIKHSEMIQIGSFGLFTKVFAVDWDRMGRMWQALEDLCYEIEWCAGIYSGYDLIRWGQRTGLLTAGEYEAWFNLLQNTVR